MLRRTQGVYHGIFPGEVHAGSGKVSEVWVLSRPHNWRPRSAIEGLLQVSLPSGVVTRQHTIQTRRALCLQCTTFDSTIQCAFTHASMHQADMHALLQEMRSRMLLHAGACAATRTVLPCRFAHDAVRHGDRVYIASTGEGAILELSYPGLQPVRKHSLFTLENHINSLAPTGNGTALWVMLHNRGEVSVGHSLVLLLALAWCLHMPVPYLTPANPLSASNNPAMAQIRQHGALVVLA